MGHIPPLERGNVAARACGRSRRGEDGEDLRHTLPSVNCWRSLILDLVVVMQDLAAEPHLLPQSPDRCAGHDPCGRHPRSPRPRRDRGRLGVPLARHQSMPQLVPLPGQAGQVRVDLASNAAADIRRAPSATISSNTPRTSPPRLVGHYPQHRRHLPHRRQRRCSLACSTRTIRPSNRRPMRWFRSYLRADSMVISGVQLLSGRLWSRAAASAGRLRPSR